MQALIGPVIILFALACLYFANRASSKEPAAGLESDSFSREDQLIGEVLTEMLNLREDIAALKAQIAVIEAAPGGRLA